MCPVTGGALLAASVLSASASAATVAAVSAIGAAAIGAGIGVAVGGAVNLATGRGFFEGAGKSALFGAVGGGLGSAITSAAPLASSFSTFETISSIGAQIGSGTGIALVAALGALMPSAPDYSGYTPAAQQNIFQQFNSQNIATTGSGGKQAASSLAGAISRANKRKLTQDDVSDLSIDTSSFSSIGLQFA